MGTYGSNLLAIGELLLDVLRHAGLVCGSVKVHRHVYATRVRDVEELRQERQHVSPLTTTGPVRIEPSVEAVQTGFRVNNEGETAITSCAVLALPLRLGGEAAPDFDNVDWDARAGNGARLDECLQILNTHTGGPANTWQDHRPRSAVKQTGSRNEILLLFFSKSSIDLYVFLFFSSFF